MRHALFLSLFYLFIGAACARADVAPIFVGQWGSYGPGPGQLEEPGRVRPSHHGTLYVSNAGDGYPRIQELTPDGQFIRDIGSFGDGPDQFWGPVFGIDVGQDGSIWLADYARARVLRFDENGNYLNGWGSKGDKDGQFYEPSGLAVAPDGTIYVADYVNARVEHFAPDGTFLGKVSDCTLSGCSFYPFDVAVDGSGFLYLIDINRDRILKYSPQGLLVSSWGVPGSGPGQFSGAFCLALDELSDLYVVDRANKRIQKFTDNGVFVCSWGTLGEAPDEFLDPTGVGVDSRGKIYVTDGQQTKVKIFAYPPPVATTPITLGWLKAHYR